ncbi:unnamed protein product [Thlaspi arvense]|uniref:Fe2OG dioxygenase domain-containing protein n=1 Tax=Thlaspi arvense TaxID=13288 RepID=A0AAU9RG44_THLAR|nr:unnamed protein product [Thlaspi arvense]
MSSHTHMEKLEAKYTGIGSCLRVPSVQDLAGVPMATIPPRYIRPDQDPPIMSDASSFPIVPVIDLQNFLSSDLMTSELDTLHFACKEWGFFQLSIHDDLWVQLGNIAKWRNELRFGFKCRGSTGYHGGIIDKSEKHYAVLLGHMAKALKMREEEVRELFKGGMQALRANYYPPCPQPELVIGLSPHSDAGLLTVLLQLRDVQGLQIKKDGIWIPVRPLPDAFIVNVGDSLEIATNGIYKSIQHRAVVHHPVVTPENPAQFKRVKVEEYYKRFLGRKLDQKSNHDAMRIQSSCEDGEDI